MNVRHHRTNALAVACLAPGSAPTLAHEGDARDQAMALVKQGVALIKARGTDRACAVITAGDAPFVERDLYLVVYGLDGTCLAHSANAAQVGKDLLDPTGVDGAASGHAPAAVERAAAGHEHRSAAHVGNRIEPRVVYCEKVEQAVA